MCTVSIIPLTGEREGMRIVFNRDEQRTRPLAEPPKEHVLHGRHVVMPRDPEGGGTWIAANDAGLVLMLLNVNDESAACRAGMADRERRSRGVIIPSLIHLGSADAVVQRALRLRGTDFAPFRLIIASTGGCVELISDGSAIRCRGAVLPGRIAMFTSSGLGDQLVESPRRRLLDALLGDGLHNTARQDAFHRHQWLDRPHLSVWMTRADARTVSRTTIELGTDQVVVRYADLDEHGDETNQTIHMLAIEADQGRSEVELAEGALA